MCKDYKLIHIAYYCLGLWLKTQGLAQGVQQNPYDINFFNTYKKDEDSPKISKGDYKDFD